MQTSSSAPQEPLDEIDYKIIDILRTDGRASFAQMAESLGVSAGMIRLRYNRLVDLGVLKVIGITNPLHMGFNTMALIGLRVQGSRLMETAQAIAALDEVIYLIVTSGSYDIICEVLCRDREQLLSFLTDRLYVIDGIRESETFVHLKIVKEIYM